MPTILGMGMPVALPGIMVTMHVIQANPTRSLTCIRVFPRESTATKARLVSPVSVACVVVSQGGPLACPFPGAAGGTGRG